MKKYYINSIKIIFLGIILAAGISFAQTWSDPGCAPTGCNAPAPINVSSAAQQKIGNLTIGEENNPGTDMLLVEGIETIFGNTYLDGDVYIGDDGSFSTPTAGNLEVMNGDLSILNLDGPGNAYACLDSNGKIFRSDVECVAAAAVYECNDGFDNSDPEDTLVDMADPGCSSPTDNSETNAAAGGKVTYTTSGFTVNYGSCPSCTPNSFKAPPGVTTINVKMWGAGGGGGGGSNSYGGGGGGGGGYAYGTITGNPLLSAIGVSVGAGGSSNNSSNGTPGGSSAFQWGGFAATGGGGGMQGVPFNQGAGGIGGTHQTVLGGTGSDGTSGNGSGTGGAGGLGGDAANGNGAIGQGGHGATTSGGAQLSNGASGKIEVTW